jgi:tRNA modification GTPase
MALRDICSQEGDVLDRGLIFWQPAPRSFTGENCVEIHAHGGRAVVAAILNVLGGIPGLRFAEAGEFTRRAFINGKLDLAQAEGLADLISAETEAQRRLAKANADGRQGVLYRNWRDSLLRARAMIEAELDFADEGDVPDTVSASIWSDLDALAGEIAAHCAGFHRAEIVRDGLDVVILGAPNAGKSSLLNALARRDVAIVSSQAGTTRDLIEVALDLEGYKVRITDTAGIRDAGNEVEQEGVVRALWRARGADLVLFLSDVTEAEDVGPPEDLRDVRFIGSKADLAHHGDRRYDLEVSVSNGAGLNELLTMLAVAVKSMTPAEEILPSRLRHVELLTRSVGHIHNALAEKPLELRAEELRLAGDALGCITGEMAVEDLLGSIFSTFCIGK